MIWGDEWNSCIQHTESFVIFIRLYSIKFRFRSRFTFNFILFSSRLHQKTSCMNVPKILKATLHPFGHHLFHLSKNRRVIHLQSKVNSIFSIWPERREMSSYFNCLNGKWKLQSKEASPWIGRSNIIMVSSCLVGLWYTLYFNFDLNIPKNRASIKLNRESFG